MCNDAGRPCWLRVGQNITAEKKVEERYRREMDYLRHNSDESLIAKGHYNLSRDLVLEYESSVKQSLYSFRPGISYQEAYEGMLRLSHSEADRRELADKLNRENLIRRYQQGQMQTTLQYCRTVEGQDPIWVSMTVHTFMRPETGDLELFSYAYDISERRLIENVMDTISQETFDFIGLIYAKTRQFEFLKKSAEIQFPQLRQKMPYSTCWIICGKFVKRGDRRHSILPWLWTISWPGFRKAPATPPPTSGPRMAKCFANKWTMSGSTRPKTSSLSPRPM